jgi:hypothetical protein
VTQDQDALWRETGPYNRLENVPDGVTVVGISAPAQIQGLGLGWLKLGQCKDEPGLDIWVAPLGSEIPAGGWVDSLGRRELGTFRAMVTESPLPDPAHQLQLEEAATIPTEATPRLAAELASARSDLRLGEAVLHRFVLAATEPSAYPGTVTGTVLKGYEAVVQLLATVHSSAPAEFHRELAVDRFTCPVCRHHRTEDLTRQMRTILDQVEAILASTIGAPMLSRDEILEVLVELQRTRDSLTWQAQGATDRWSLVNATAKRIQASRQRPIAVTEVAQVERAFNERVTR